MPRLSNNDRNQALGMLRTLLTITFNQGLIFFEILAKKNFFLVMRF
jgi:hypothetical protein